MPSFDIVAEPDVQEIRNAVEQARKEVRQRYDLKDSGAEIEFENDQMIRIDADNDFFVRQITDVLIGKLARRNIDPLFFEQGEIIVSPSGKARRELTLKKGIPQELGKQIVKKIKETKLKVQPAIRGDEVRVSGKKRDDLQQVIAMLKEAEFDRPLQFTNFRD
ncbi:MAG: YajQ family cyclic di-GMP-binding protein [Candidatus Dadabacteria bacterium]|nr:MAG: YajQ family cyclic di-GMP-binding protein [Candidatus Dadabacteria bacterium]